MLVSFVVSMLLPFSVQACPTFRGTYNTRQHLWVGFCTLKHLFIVAGMLNFSEGQVCVEKQGYGNNHELLSLGQQAATGNGEGPLTVNSPISSCPSATLPRDGHMDRNHRSMSPGLKCYEGFQTGNTSPNSSPLPAFTTGFQSLCAELCGLWIWSANSNQNSFI
jgi:hypothetical protein